MSKLSDLKQYRQRSLKHSLEDFYRELSERAAPLVLRDKPLTEDQIEIRAQAYREMRGKFVALHREKSNRSVDDISQQLEWSSTYYDAFEKGNVPCSDAEFFKLCSLVGANQEVSLFLEKIEEALNPVLCESRRLNAELLKSHGFGFADSAKYDKSEKGKVIAFVKKKNEG
jgi:hypothetical protein